MHKYSKEMCLLLDSCAFPLCVPLARCFSALSPNTDIEILYRTLTPLRGLVVRVAGACCFQIAKEGRSTSKVDVSP